MRSLVTCLVCWVISTQFVSAQDRQFEAIGPLHEQRLPRNKLLGAVRVTFDLLPTSMSFDLPWHYCAVSENGIKIAHFAAETYDPRNWDGQGADASFEAGMDKEARFARVWIEHQSDARIVVRVRYALTNSKYEIAHDDLVSDSPFNDGKGDWGEERFTIYPDGTYVRHMTIHSGLAGVSQPFGFYREPPHVVHEFMEAIVIGPKGHTPLDDIETSPTLTLFKMFGAEPGVVYPKGIYKDIDYKLPQGPPAHYGEFRDANIMLLHSKSQYKSFTIGLPYGVNVSPYGWEANQRFPVATWTDYEEPSIGYVAAIGHMINWWHYRRSEKTIEQIYLHGMTSEAKPADHILPLAWSWISPPELQLPGDKLSPNGSTGKYNQFTYDPTQRAYVLPRNSLIDGKIEFSLDAIYDDAHLTGTMWLVNPVFVIPQWAERASDIRLRIGDEYLQPGTDFRTGIEDKEGDKQLVIWVRRTIDLNSLDDHFVQFCVEPKLLPRK